MTAPAFNSATKRFRIDGRRADLARPLGFGGAVEIDDHMADLAHLGPGGRTYCGDGGGQAADRDRRAFGRRVVAGAALGPVQDRDFGKFRRRAIREQDDDAGFCEVRHFGTDRGDPCFEKNRHVANLSFA